jgi:hypothetical protein
MKELPEVPAMAAEPSKPVYTYTPPPSYRFPMEKPELIFGLLLVAFSMIMTNGALFAGANLAFAFGILGNLLSTGGYLLVKKHRSDGYTAALLGLCILIIAAFPRSADAGMKTLAVLALLTVPSLAFCLMAGQNRFPATGITTLLDAPRVLFAMGLGRLAESARGLKDACSSSGAIGKKGSSVVLGLVIAIPLVAILIPLLMFADAAFEGLLDLLPEIRWNEILTTLIVGLYIGWILYSRAAALQYLPKTETPRKNRKGLNTITVNTVLFSVSAVYVVYLLSQLAYFVGGFSGILPDGFTRAEYARRGFFEMTCLAGINLGLMTFGVSKVRHTGRTPGSTRALCLFLGLVTEFLAASSIAKMAMYIGSYGLTRLRVLTTVIMVFLAITTALVCIWLYLPKLQYMQAVMLLALSIGAAVLWLDVDTQVAKYNVNHYLSGDLATVDMDHLFSLGAGAVPWMEELTECADPELRTRATAFLRCWTLEQADDFREFTWINHHAQQIIANWQEETP